MSRTRYDRRTELISPEATVAFKDSLVGLKTR